MFRHIVMHVQWANLKRRDENHHENIALQRWTYTESPTRPRSEHGIRRMRQYSLDPEGGTKKERLRLMESTAAERLLHNLVLVELHDWVEASRT